MDIINGVHALRRAAAEDEVRHLKRESRYMHHATTVNNIQQVTEGSSAKSDVKDNYLYQTLLLRKEIGERKNSSSKDAQTIEETIRHCEEPSMNGEKKMCTSSLESMVDISLNMLGTNNVHAVTTEVEGETQMLQKYTIEEVQEITDGDNLVCHKLSYAFAVYNCHVGGRTKIFMVSMVVLMEQKLKQY
uniref:Dehydration-responsive protein RD22-like n=1 Tax=Nicotiana sylvestris TaxID=4096 RepID=A0A1U7VR96_NICSY|nr:PREDICTED: dehydration-responsive protein RD22-like [Nicotiana sylvestris]